jgi:hypothetical protein
VDGASVAAAASVVTLRETLRLDVDGRYPQMAVSGTVFRFLTERTHWIARLTRQADGSWTGPIWYKDGDTTAFLYTQPLSALTSAGRVGGDVRRHIPYGIAITLGLCLVVWLTPAA